MSDFRLTFQNFQSSHENKNQQSHQQLEQEYNFQQRVQQDYQIQQKRKQLEFLRNSNPNHFNYHLNFSNTTIFQNNTVQNNNNFLKSVQNEDINKSINEQIKSQFLQDRQRIIQSQNNSRILDKQYYSEKKQIPKKIDFQKVKTISNKKKMKLVESINMKKDFNKILNHFIEKNKIKIDMRLNFIEKIKKLYQIQKKVKKSNKSLQVEIEQNNITSMDFNQEQIENQKNEILNLQEQLKSKDDRVLEIEKDLEEQITFWQKQEEERENTIKTQKEKIKQMLTEYNKLISMNQKLVSNLEQTDNKFNEQILLNKQQQEQIQAQYEQIQQFQENIQKLEDKLQLKKQIKDCNSVILEGEKVEIEHLVQSEIHEQQNIQNQDELQQFIDQLITNNKIQQEKFDKEIQQKNQKIKELTQKLENINIQKAKSKLDQFMNDKVKIQNKNLQNKIEILLENQKELEESKERYHKENKLLFQEMMDIKEHCENLLEDKSIYDKQIEKINKKNKELQELNKNQELVIIELNKQIENNQQQDDLQEIIEKQEQELENRRQLEQLLQDEINQIKEQKENLKDDNNKLNKKIKQLVSQNNVFVKQIKELSQIDQSLEDSGIQLQLNKSQVLAQEQKETKQFQSEKKIDVVFDKFVDNDNFDVSEFNSQANNELRNSVIESESQDIRDFTISEQLLLNPKKQEKE